MSHTFALAFQLLAVALGAPAPRHSAQPAPDASHAQPATNRQSLLGTWRVTHGTIAPWVTDARYHPDTTSWIGKTIRFDATRVGGPGTLNCSSARYEATSVAAAEMFQGGFATSPTAQALKVGIAKFPVAGISLTCSTGIYEFHFRDSTTALLAMSNVIWTLAPVAQR